MKNVKNEGIIDSHESAVNKIEMIKEYLEPTGITITELIDRNALASLCQLLDAFLFESVCNTE